jgi:hypothetical protein
VKLRCPGGGGGHRLFYASMRRVAKTRIACIYCILFNTTGRLINTSNLLGGVYLKNNYWTVRKTKLSPLQCNVNICPRPMLSRTKLLDNESLVHIITASPLPYPQLKISPSPYIHNLIHPLPLHINPYIMFRNPISLMRKY